MNKMTVVFREFDVSGGDRRTVVTDTKDNLEAMLKAYIQYIYDWHAANLGYELEHYSDGEHAIESGTVGEEDQLTLEWEVVEVVDADWGMKLIERFRSEEVDE